MSKWKERSMFRRLTNKGFTLIEIALVLAVGGLLIASFSSYLLNFHTLAQQKDMRNRMSLITEAVQEFLEVNGRVPCPASITAAIDTANFGREVSDATTLCNAVTAGSGIFVSGSGANRVVHGAVPVRTLNLPDDYHFDAFGNRFTFAVTANQATTGLTFSDNDGAIIVNDSAGNAIVPDATAIPPIPGATFIIVSHGRNRHGGFTVEGAEYGPCNDGTTNEQQNCNDNRTFVDTMLVGDDFDDFVSFKAGRLLTSAIPSGAVMSFDRGSCPAGWTAFPDAIGRAVIGAGTFNGALAAGELAGAGAEDAVYGLGQQGGSILRADSDPLTVTHDNNGHFTPQGATTYDNRVPYLALTYCRKN